MPPLLPPDPLGISVPFFPPLEGFGLGGGKSGGKGAGTPGAGPGFGVGPGGRFVWACAAPNDAVQTKNKNTQTPRFDM